MIHYDVCQGKMHLMVNGNVDEVLADSAVMIFTIYRQLLKKSACVAEICREFFEHNGETIFAPEEALKEKLKEEVKSAERTDEIDELLETLLEKIKIKKRKRGKLK